VILSIGIYSIGGRLMICCILEAACMLLNFAHDASTSLAPIVLEAASQDLDCRSVRDKRFWERMDNGSKWQWILHYCFTDFSISTILLG
jgi:hypothetical protein